ncbi:hypothetical protein HYC85_025399 [Camellia sinensis]|uniref:EF-hand domain-containing protein n=1 Tax=Camellia sinensis TaxID=4442 RepID=A0A7J7GAW7_CAMSI|nr:hypothetical protein HYC85_025399 [Camellia sinensis]
MREEGLVSIAEEVISGEVMLDFSDRFQSDFDFEVLSLDFEASPRGGALSTGDAPKDNITETKLKAKMVEVMQRRASEGSSMTSFNSIILKFPKIDESLRKCKAIIEQFVRVAQSCLIVAEEMDCDRNGMVNFKEFLFAFTCWVANDDIEDDKGGK